MTAKHFTVADIAQRLNAEFVGDGSHRIKSIASLDSAGEADISFLNNPKYKKTLETTNAGCVLLSATSAQFFSGNAILLEDPYLGFALVAQLLDTTPVPEPAIHPTAQVSDSCIIGKSVSIGAGCVVEENCQLGDGVALGANTVVASGSSIGASTRIYANVSIYHNVVIGEECLLHAGSVIGSDGFGFANKKGEWVKIPQLGRVLIGDRVEIGANACIDRGALDDTVIGNGVKLDNLCHIAHNVELGQHVAMAAYAGVAGSTKVGDYATFSGRATILGHLNIAAGTHVTACSLINRSNKQPGIFSSGTGMQDNKSWRKSVARFRQLDEMARQIKDLQKQIDKLQSDS